MQINFYNWNGNFDSSQSTYVITHGFQDNGRSNWIAKMADNLRWQDPNSNIISVDWSSGADTFYSSAVSNTVTVGQSIAEYLVNIGANSNTTQLIGHSLGAHISGIAADRFDDLTGSAIDTIVGLDAAGPLYEFSNIPLSQRLDATDAQRVIAFHTSSTLGYDPSLADLDLYVNWDRWLQPGQWTFAGNHSYAHQLYNQLLQGASFRQDTLNASGTHFDLFDINNDFLTGSIEVNTYTV